MMSRKSSSDGFDVQDGSQDLFDRLLHANTQGSKEDDSSFSPQEVLGNIFAFLFAGHGDTLSALASCMELTRLQKLQPLA
jgi:cytochrome P450